AGLPWPVALLLTALLGVPAALATAHLFPRRVSARRPERVVRLLLPPLRPLGVVMRLLLPSRGADGGDALADVWQEGLATGVGSRDQMAMAGGVLAFRARSVRDVMTPRTAVVAVAEEATLDDITAVFTSSGYSRLPVYRGTLDEIVGMLHAFDLFKLRPGDPLPVRPVAVSPGSRGAAALLVDMQRERRHLAVVLDEFGGTLGIVSLEDLLEELVGEIFDEHDGVTAPAGEGDPPFLEADGGTPVAAVSERFGVALDAGRATTVAGLLAEAAGRIPRAGERFLLGGLEFDVIQATPARAERVLIRPGPVLPVALTRRAP
ncbi:MAG TPA: hemolysin family protein, partial [Gemmatimonadales bacterium]|nr:hemolysin family protein [Gemmatimonadales bacterium]